MCDKLLLAMDSSRKLVVCDSKKLGIVKDHGFDIPVKIIYIIFIDVVEIFLLYLGMHGRLFIMLLADIEDACNESPELKMFLGIS